jgi:uncharacterized RDD family membrane protein YckC
MSHHHDHEEISIETLSTPPIRIYPAPLTRRIVAGAIDSFAVFLLWLTLIGEWGNLSISWVTASVGSVPAITLAYLVATTFVYYFVLEWIFASTIGKWLLRLRVVGKDGDPCSLGASLKRNLLRFLDWLPLFYIIATLCILISHDRQRLGDRVASTIVTKVPEKDINPPPAPFLFH